MSVVGPEFDEFKRFNLAEIQAARIATATAATTAGGEVVAAGERMHKSN
jgi:hypothetical protein